MLDPLYSYKTSNEISKTTKQIFWLDKHLTKLPALINIQPNFYLIYIHTTKYSALINTQNQYKLSALIITARVKKPILVRIERINIQTNST